MTTVGLFDHVSIGFLYAALIILWYIAQFLGSDIFTLLIILSLLVTLPRPFQLRVWLASKSVIYDSFYPHSETELSSDTYVPQYMRICL